MVNLGFKRNLTPEPKLQHFIASHFPQAWKSCFTMKRAFSKTYVYPHSYSNARFILYHLYALRQVHSFSYSQFLHLQNVGNIYHAVWYLRTGVACTQHLTQCLTGRWQALSKWQPLPQFL